MVASVSGPCSLLVAGCGAQEGFLLRDQLPPQAEGPRPQLLSANPGAVDPRLGSSNSALPRRTRLSPVPAQRPAPPEPPAQAPAKGRSRTARSCTGSPLGSGPWQRPRGRPAETPPPGPIEPVAVLSQSYPPSDEHHKKDNQAPSIQLYCRGSILLSRRLLGGEEGDEGFQLL